jgi:hypothetical protein
MSHFTPPDLTIIFKLGTYLIVSRGLVKSLSVRALRLAPGLGVFWQAVVR